MIASNESGIELQLLNIICIGKNANKNQFFISHCDDAWFSKQRHGSVLICA